MSYLQESNRKAVTVTSLQAMRAAGDRIAMLTAYDASFAALMDRNGTDVLLVGDSLGNVMQGQKTRLPVTLDHIVYHTECVSRGIDKALLVSDLPFGTYGTPEQAFHSAVRVMQAGAQMIKLEGGVWLADTIKFLTERGIPVCAHIGLTPQSVHQLGGFKVQGKTSDGATQLHADALAVQQAGASLVVIEAVPATLGKEVTDRLAIPTIGIGAGPDCSGQVLVMHDMLGVFPGHKSRFVRNFMDGASGIEEAVRHYVAAVRDGSFPAQEHCF